MVKRKTRLLIRNVNNTLIAVVMLFMMMTIGVVGYQVIEGYTFDEALYMVVITMSTVGFTEVQPLSTQGHLFTVILIFASLGIFASILSTISRFLIDGGFRDYYFDRKLDRRIKRMGSPDQIDRIKKTIQFQDS